MICRSPMHKITYPIKLLAIPNKHSEHCCGHSCHILNVAENKNKCKLSDAYLPNRDPTSLLTACCFSWFCKQASSSVYSVQCFFAVLCFLLVISPLEMVWRVILKCCLVFASSGRLRWAWRRSSVHYTTSFKPVC